MDQALIAAVQRGDTTAFSALYTTHFLAAYRFARVLGGDDAEDLVAEAFARVLAALTGRCGRVGDTVAFRPYLLATLRNACYAQSRKKRRLAIIPAEDLAAKVDADPVMPVDPAVRSLEQSLVRRAWANLPQRWRTVLWWTVIEELAPAEVAARLDLPTLNAASVLAYRAREGLAHAYLQLHLSEPATRICQEVTARMAMWTRGRLGPREKWRVEAHLDDCGRCRAAAEALRDVNARAC